MFVSAVDYLQLHWNFKSADISPQLTHLAEVAGRSQAMILQDLNSSVNLVETPLLHPYSLTLLVIGLSTFAPCKDFDTIPGCTTDQSPKVHGHYSQKTMKQKQGLQILSCERHSTADQFSFYLVACEFGS